MSWNNQGNNGGGLNERGFEVSVDGRSVPGVYWAPEGGADRLVLLGHGGTTHKKIDYLVHIAHLAAGKGIATMAIDGPGHGDRAEKGAKPGPEAFAKAWNSGGGTEAMVADWSSALDFIEAEEGARPTGWWGLSMGTMMGLPVCAMEKRIRVALLGLMGTWGPNAADLKRLAPEVKCPLRFLMQWDDEVVPRDTCIELFGLLGSKRKTLHANPGAHSAVPEFETTESVDYLDRYLR